MDIWSNTCKICDQCGVRYAPRRDISFKQKHFCSFICKDDYIEYKSQLVLPIEVPIGDVPRCDE